MTTSNLPTSHAASPTRRRAGLFTLLRHPRAIWRFLADGRAPVLPRIVAVLTLAYVLLPFDAIPDVIPVIGWLDDLGVVTLALGYVASQAARYINDAAAPAQLAVGPAT